MLLLKAFSSASPSQLPCLALSPWFLTKSSMAMCSPCRKLRILISVQETLSCDPSCKGEALKCLQAFPAMLMTKRINLTKRIENTHFVLKVPFILYFHFWKISAASRREAEFFWHYPKQVISGILEYLDSRLRKAFQRLRLRVPNEAGGLSLCKDNSDKPLLGILV